MTICESHFLLLTRSVSVFVFGDFFADCDFSHFAVVEGGEFAVALRLASGGFGTRAHHKNDDDDDENNAANDASKEDGILDE